MTNRLGNARLVLTLVAACLTTAGCLTSGDSEDSPDTPVDPGPDATNRAPTISGNPPPAVVVGQNYSFTPSASDPDGDQLTFAIQGKPAWAEFDPDTGSLSGLATMGSEGSYPNISITVSDGVASASLPSFAVEVTQSALGSVTLSWTPPTQNEDGSALVDLAGYNIYYGTSPGNYDTTIRIDNPGVVNYVVENLSPNTYYFVATAFNSGNVESDFSTGVSTVVN